MLTIGQFIEVLLAIDNSDSVNCLFPQHSESRISFSLPDLNLCVGQLDTCLQYPFFSSEHVH